jgi:tripartite-type tricarboxylate transporter receptor subunit TctC
MSNEPSYPLSFFGLHTTAKQLSMRFDKHIIGAALALILGVGAQTSDAAETPAAPTPAAFYDGKTVNIIVGFGPGGGYDLYARLLARYLSNYIAGKPNVVVQNMDGAGGVRAANYVYSAAPKDGTVIAGVNQGASLYQALNGQGALYDASQFQWLGSMAYSNNTIYTSAHSGIKNIEDAKQHDVSMAGSGVISDANIYPAVFNKLVGTKFRVINGYTGTNDSNLAIERGEVDGRGGGAYSSLVSTKPDWLAQKKIYVIAQIGFKKEPDLPDVPLLLDLVHEDVARQMAVLVTVPTAVGYNHWLAPDVPAERVSILRKAYEKAMTDTAMADEARKMSLEIRPKTSAELEELTKNVAAVSPEIKQRLREILGW